MDKEKMIEFAGEQCKIFPEESEMGKYLRETLKILQESPCEDVPDTNVGNIMQKEPCEDCVSRKSLKHKLQERHDFFVDAYGGFINLPQKDKARVDAITNCIAMVVNEPPVKPAREKGKWILTDDDMIYCSECEDSYYPRPIDASWKYCPNCGCLMEGEE